VMTNNYNYYKNLFTGLCLLLLTVFVAIPELEAQDPRFSQINASSMFVSPAMTGLYEGQMRVSFNYRDQWSSFLGQVPFRTFGASVDYRFHALKSDFFSLGLTVLKDEAGDAKLSMNRINMSASYMKQLTGGRGWRNVQYLIAGAQVGMGQNSINWATLRFSTQFDGSGYNATLPTGEDVGSYFNFYPDINAGLMWYALFDKNKSVYAGASMHHINRPNISFLDDIDETMYATIILHGGGQIPFTKDISLLPVARFMKQGPSYEIDFGASIRFTTRDFRDVALKAGVMGRLVNGADAIGADAVSILTALEWDKWALGLSYDVTVSSLSNTNDGRGAFEVSLTYIHPPSRRLRMYCPKF
jgi:type IX secretion system PorP/SprF family membrane protein